VEHITGQELEVKAAGETSDKVVEEELESLRNQVEELSEEVSARNSGVNSVS
jgi:diaphanous 1